MTSFIPHFIHPWLFLLLPLPALWYYLGPRWTIPPRHALSVPFFKDLLSLSHENPIYPSRSFYVLYSLWILLLIAAARPVWFGDPIYIPQKSRDIVLVTDISRSMQITDMQLRDEAVDRLALVKNIAKDFIIKRQGDRVGLILFGSHAYWQTPLTHDLTTVQWMLDDATIGLAGPETAIGDAIALALKSLPDEKKSRSRLIILLTDGANNAGSVLPLTSSKIAAKLHVRIYTIGLGAEHLTIKTHAGNSQDVNPSRDLDEKTLQKIADNTQGLFFRAKDPAMLKTIYEKINTLEPVETDRAIVRPQTELYMWPLGFAWLLIMLGLCRWRF